MGFSFFLFMTLVLFFPIWTLGSPDLETAIGLSSIAGLLFGPYSAWIQRRNRKRLELPPWAEIVKKE